MTGQVRPIRTLIVDDEQMARASIRVLLGGDPEIELVGECSSGVEAVTTIAARAPDLVFLDVQMPRMNGFEVLAALGDTRRFVVVFVTAFDSYALDAFDVQALDYVLKPFDDRRFQRALERAKDQIRHARLDHLASELVHVMAGAAPTDKPAAAAVERIVIRDGGRTVLIPLADIDWVEAADYYVQLHVGAKSYLLREPLRDLEARLDPRRFVRIHRSTIVAIDRVAELRPSAHGDHCVRLREVADARLHADVDVDRPSNRRNLAHEIEVDLDRVAAQVRDRVAADRGGDLEAVAVLRAIGAVVHLQHRQPRARIAARDRDVDFVDEVEAFDHRGRDDLGADELEVGVDLVGELVHRRQVVEHEALLERVLAAGHARDLEVGIVQADFLGIDLEIEQRTAGQREQANTEDESRSGDRVHGGAHFAR
jgi:two-component system LytT family response regulator